MKYGSQKEKLPLRAGERLFQQNLTKAAVSKNGGLKSNDTTKGMSLYNAERKASLLYALQDTYLV